MGCVLVFPAYHMLVFGLLQFLEITRFRGIKFSSPGQLLFLNNYRNT